MIKIATLILIVFLVGFLAYACAQKEEEEMKMRADPAAELANSVKNGAQLFSDTALGTNGDACVFCHLEGGTKEGKVQDMVIPAWDNLAAKYPKYFKKAKRVFTLDQVVNFCIINALKGKALAWDDQKLTDLTAYCASVKKAQ